MDLASDEHAHDDRTTLTALGREIVLRVQSRVGNLPETRHEHDQQIDPAPHDEPAPTGFEGVDLTEIIDTVADCVVDSATTISAYLYDLAVCTRPCFLQPTFDYRVPYSCIPPGTCCGPIDEWLYPPAEWTRPEGAYTAQQIVSMFSELILIHFKANKQHTHGHARAATNTARLFMQMFAAELGYEYFNFQMSNADLAEGLKGYRKAMWAKDLSLEEQFYSHGDMRGWSQEKRTRFFDSVGDSASEFNALNNHLVCLIDVCQYIDMPKFLTDNCAPVCIYTFQPESVGANGVESGDMSFTFIDDELHMSLPDGAHYQHKVWNYCKDNFVVGDWKPFYESTCSPCTPDWYYVETSYLVHRHKVADHRFIVILAPNSTHKSKHGPCRHIQAPSLQRLQVQQPMNPDGLEFNRMIVISPKGNKLVSTGYVGASNSATIITNLDDDIASGGRTSSVQINNAYVKSKTSEAQYFTVDKSSLSILTEYHRTKRTTRMLVNLDTVCTITKSLRTIQFVNRDGHYEPSLKTGMEAFMKPLFDNAFAPVIDLAAEQVCVRSRVTEIQHKEDITPDAFTMIAMNEFVHHLTYDYNGSRIILHPVEQDEVFAKQSRPSQTRILNEAVRSGPRVSRHAKCFVKREAASKVAMQPRNITQINAVDKLDWSQICYAIAEHIKTFPWYAFGKTPKEIAEEVRDLCVQDGVKAAVLSDFSRMDGRTSSVLRMLERRLCLAWFPDYISEIDRLLQSQQHLDATCTFGTTFETLWSRLSGSPETSIFNTIAAAFVAYLAIRMTFIPGSTLHWGQKDNGVEAFERLGIYGGDDGFTMDVNPEAYEKAAKRVGQLLTYDVIKNGEPGLMFLARWYGEQVWHGDPSSCCDLLRQLSKFHATRVLPPGVTSITKLVEKAQSFYLTDPNTPIIGKFCEKVLKLAAKQGIIPDPTKDVHQIRQWFSKHESAVQFPNQNVGNWMEQLVFKDNYDLSEFNEWLEHCEDLEDMLYTPQLKERPCIHEQPHNKDDVVCEDQYLDGTERNGKNRELRRKQSRKVKARQAKGPSAAELAAKKTTARVSSKTVTAATKEKKGRKREEQTPLPAIQEEDYPPLTATFGKVGKNSKAAGKKNDVGRTPADRNTMKGKGKDGPNSSK